MSTTLPFRHARALAGLLLAALAMMTAALPAIAQTTPCDAIFEPMLASGIAEADLHLRRQWRMFEATWVAAYRLEGEKANPFDPARLRALSPQRPAEGKPGPSQAQPRAKTTPAAPLPPITGFATARDVRCNASAASAKPDVILVFTAAGVRFQEGRGPWSAVVPNTALAIIQLRRAGTGWTLVDRTAERGAMPPDAQRSPPHDTLARQLATIPWLPPRKRRKAQR